MGFLNTDGNIQGLLMLHEQAPEVEHCGSGGRILVLPTLRVLLA